MSCIEIAYRSGPSRTKATISSAERFKSTPGLLKGDGGEKPIIFDPEKWCLSSFHV